VNNGTVRVPPKGMRTHETETGRSFGAASIKGRNDRALIPIGGGAVPVRSVVSVVDVKGRMGQDRRTNAGQVHRLQSAHRQ